MHAHAVPTPLQALGGVYNPCSPLLPSSPSLSAPLQATEEYLEWYKQQKEQLAKEGGGENGGAPAAAAPGDSAEENAALARVMELISQRPPVAGKAEGGSAAAAADTFLSGLSAAGAGERGTSTADDRRRDREAEREAERERQRQRREEARRAEADERAYRDAARQWEDHERCAAWACAAGLASCAALGLAGASCLCCWKGRCVPAAVALQASLEAAVGAA